MIDGMARLKKKDVLEDSASDKSFSHVENGSTLQASDRLRSSPRKNVAKSYCDDSASSDSGAAERRQKPVAKVNETTQRKPKQVRLVNLNKLDLSTAKFEDVLPLRDRDGSKESRVGKTKLSQRPGPSERKSPSKPVYLSDSSAEIEVEESVWCGSDRSSDDSDEELPSPRKFIRLPSKTKQPQSNLTALNFSKDVREPSAPLAGNPFSGPKATEKSEPVSSRPQSSSDKENAAAFLKFSPPRLYSPAKSRQQDRPVTPPQSPSKSRLQSPSKTKPRVPSPKFRQSLDAFWDVDTVNDWNDQYSPQKVLNSPRKLKFLEDVLASPTSSPRKPKSPGKSTRAERDLKKDFDSRKHTIAENFLAELDKVVTDEKIKELAASTGGVHFIWSKTLNSTAGRANWRKETTKIRNADGTVDTTHKHHASIELAEKVIDDENRLLNVIAHEFCHLANFMISGIKDKPHGQQFKEWGRKCTQAFKHRGVEVTTKHSYQIEYKYIWQCSNEDCAVEFKRHSKSIDPKRHTCGTCRSKLVQIKPAPRKDAGNATGYAAFVKANFAEVKRGMVGASQKEVMEAVGRKYRAEKSAKESAATSVEINDIARGLEVITIEDD